MGEGALGNGDEELGAVVGVAADRKAKKGADKRATMRVGRPSRAMAGEVDSRVLAAARQVFLERGLAGATIDEIARVARAGKATIYARFPTKEALLGEVATQTAARVRAGFETYAPAGVTIDERLANMASEILRRLLVPEVLDFMRLCVAEARRFPDVAGVGRLIRERATEAVARALSEVTRSDQIGRSPAFAADRLGETAQFFMDIVVERLLMRGLFGEDPALLRAEVDARVERSVAFFLAACRPTRSATTTHSPR